MTAGASASRRWWVAGLGICAVIVVAASIWASAHPDGLEWVAEQLGFLDAGEAPGYQILPDYTVPGIDGPISTVLAGLIGMLLVFGVMVGVGRLLARRRG